MKNTTIRAYNTADREAVMALLRLNTPEYFAPEEEKDFEDYLENHIEQYYVLEYENQVVGCGGINFAENGSTGVISWDIFHPRHQGKGFGKALLQFRLEKLKRTAGIQTIRVRTSQLTHQFYAKQGFELKEIVKDYWAEGLDLYYMVYHLNDKSQA